MFIFSGQTRSTVVGGAMMMTNSPKVNNVAKPKMYNKLPLNEMVSCKRQSKDQNGVTSTLV